MESSIKHRKDEDLNGDESVATARPNAGVDALPALADAAVLPITNYSTTKIDFMWQKGGGQDKRKQKQGEETSLP